MIKNRSKVVLFFLLVLAVSCNNKRKNKEIVNKSGLEISYDTTTFTFYGNVGVHAKGGANMIFKNGAMIQTINYCGDGTLKLRSFKNHADTMDVLNFPNPTCQTLYTLLKDSTTYVVTASNMIYQLDRDSIREIANLMNIPKFKKSGMKVSGIKFQTNEHVGVPNSVLLFRLRKNYRDTTGKFYVQDSAFPLFGKYNLDTRTFQFFGSQPYDVEMTKYGFASYISDLYIGDSIITSRFYDGRIKIINTTNDSVTVLNIKSKYDTVPIQPWVFHTGMKNGTRSKIMHKIVSPIYGGLYYNPYLKQYYRIFYPKQSKYDKKGLFHTLDDKQPILMVLNDKLEPMGEIKLPIKGMHPIIIPSKEGLMIPIDSQINNAFDKLKVLEIKIKNDDK